jgi:vesicle coat complex subunit
VFYCKFNDPVYVKIEKVDILIKVADKNNCDQILLELKEYASDVDTEIIGAAVKAIGQIVLKIETSVRTAAQVIHDIVKNGQTLALQEAVVVAKDILRKYPGKYESLIKDLAKKNSEYFEVEAKASILWIVGEYAEKIPDSLQIIEGYQQQFLEDPIPVQL